MRAVDQYSQRAISYARYRWDYAPAAVEAIVKECGLTENSIIADIGSGTGMLTRHFADRVGTVFAVEPNSDMRGIAAQTLHGCKAWQSIDGFSDATTLPECSVDMITVGRALHWFRPTRRGPSSPVLSSPTAGWPSSAHRVPIKDSWRP